jgi:hypothetical protein
VSERLPVQGRWRGERLAGVIKWVRVRMRGEGVRDRAYIHVGYAWCAVSLLTHADTLH